MTYAGHRITHLGCPRTILGLYDDREDARGMTGLPVDRRVLNRARGYADVISGGGEEAWRDLLPGCREGLEGSGAGGACLGVITMDWVDPEVSQDWGAHVERLARGEGGDTVWQGKARWGSERRNGRRGAGNTR